MRLQVSRARVFDKAIRDVARDIRDMARECIYAGSLDETKETNVQLRQLYGRFNDIIAGALPVLY